MTNPYGRDRAQWERVLAIIPLYEVGSAYAHRLAVMLECALLDPTGAWTDAHALLDEYRAACRAAGPDQEPPTLMGEPVVPHLTRWVMHDNHTFTRLPSDNIEAYATAMRCFDRHAGWVTLCGTWSDERTNPGRKRPPSLESGARETRLEFGEAVFRWLHEHPAVNDQVKGPSRLAGEGPA